MSDTDRDKPYRPFSHEGPWARKLTRRRERSRTRDLLRTGRHDLADTRQTKGTCGWITW